MRRSSINELLFELFIFIAVFFSSILGAQAFGISLNKIALIPIELYLVSYCVKHGINFQIKKNVIPLIVFYVVQVLGSLIGLLNSLYYKYDNYIPTLTNNIVQNLIFYIPILVICSNLKSNIYDNFIRVLVKQLLFVCRLHCIYAILQFSSWYFLDFDLNNFLFNDILNGTLGDNYKTEFVNLDGVIRLRVTGLNYEPAMLSFIMLLGICMDKSVFFKFLYLLSCVLALSRSGIITILIVFLYQMFKFAKANQYRISKNSVIKGIIVFILIVLLFIICYFNITPLRDQVDSIIDRILNFSTENSGDNRHLMYPIYAFYSWTIDLGLVEKLVGVGARVGGIVFTHSPYVSDMLTFNNLMLNSAWEIECDTAAILLGDGLIGFIAYLTIIIRLMKSIDIKVTSFGLGLLIFGIMYDCFTFTLTQIVIILFLTNLKGRKVVKNERSNIIINNHCNI